MSDYIVITDYAAKDALLTGNPAKLVKGTEIKADFDAVAVAVATKHDSTDIGVAVQAYDAFLTSIATLGTAADKMIYTTAANTAAESAITTAGRALLDDATASDQLTTLGVSAFAKTILDDADEATFKATVNLEIGVDVQAYDVDTAKLDVDQSWTGAQRGAVTADNDLSFDLAVTNNFSCTPSAGGTLTFTNHTAGQSGMILLTNGSNYAIAAAATTKIHATDLATISATGVWLLCYFDNGTNTYVTVSRDLT